MAVHRPRRNRRWQRQEIGRNCGRGSSSLAFAVIYAEGLSDAWFGDGSGPLQHLNIASYRAIEEGLPMVRATPTGISAVIDPLGRVIRSLPLGSEGVIDSPLPRPLPPTPFKG